MSSPQEACAFTVLDRYSRSRHNCFLTEMFLDSQKKIYTLCFRPTDVTRGSANIGACRYLQISASEVNIVAEQNALTDAIRSRLDEELPSLRQQGQG
jgi:hypothetical protein